MANEVRIIVTAQDKTKGTFKGLKSAIGGVLTGAAVLGTGIVLAMGKASEAARDAAKVHAQTKAVIKSTGGAAKITAKQMEDMATRISKVTGLDDELILSAENMLATFTNVRNDFKKNNMIFDDATQVIADMSTALGQDMQTSAIQVGKALNDPIKGIGSLQRVGVTFTDKQKEVIKKLVKTGDVAGAQKVILHELTKEFGGSAEAQATWADKAKVAAGDIEESFGGLVNKIFAPLGEWVVEEGAPALQAFMASLENDPNISKALTDLMETLGKIDFAKVLAGVTEELPRFLENVDKAIQKWQEFTSLVDEFEKATGEEQGGPLGGMANAVARNIKKIGNSIQGGWDTMTAWVVAKTEQFVGAVVAWFARLPGRVLAWVKKTVTDVKRSFVEHHRLILADVRRFLERVVSGFTGFYTRLRSSWSNFWGRVKKTGSDAITSVRNTIGRVLGQIATGFSRGVSAIGRAWNRLRDIANTPVQFVVHTVLEGGLL